MNRESRYATAVAIILALVPFGYTMPVTPKCICWGISFAIGFFVVSGFPALHRFALLPRTPTCVALVALAFLCFWPAIHKQWNKEKSVMVQGFLVAQDRGWLGPNDPLVIRIGDGGTRLTYTGPISGPAFTSPAGVAYREYLALERGDGKVLVSAMMLDRNHDLLATIDRNIWRVYPRNLSDKNYDKDSLEIKDSRGRVVFQIRVQTKEVWLQWEWASSDTSSAGILESGKYKIETGFAPMFKYPSDAYWGELSGNYH